ncbi:MAG: hypothetical protein RLZZ273_1295 [Bacteroidota bacterium]|jgi:hypothetical protein
MHTAEQEDHKNYGLHDEVWRNHGLAAPARRALVSAGIFEEKHLRMHTVDELRQLHGVGNKALEQLQAIIGKA